MNKFIECYDCSRKPGMPTLCDSCISTRDRIEELNRISEKMKSVWCDVQIKRELFRFLNLKDWVDNSSFNYANHKGRMIDWMAISQFGLVCRTDEQFYKTDKDDGWPIIVYELM